MDYKMIGIVGGMGSYTDIDLTKKIHDIHNTACEQNQLPISILSVPNKIADRTEYLG